MKMLTATIRLARIYHRLIARLPRCSSSFHMTMMLVTMEPRAFLFLAFTGLAYLISEYSTQIDMVEIFWSGSLAMNLVDLKRMQNSFLLIMVSVFQKVWKILTLSGFTGHMHLFLSPRKNLSTSEIWTL